MDPRFALPKPKCPLFSPKPVHNDDDGPSQNLQNRHQNRDPPYWKSRLLPQNLLKIDKPPLSCQSSKNPLYPPRDPTDLTRMDPRYTHLKIKGLRPTLTKRLKTYSLTRNAHFPPRKASRIDEDGPSKPSRNDDDGPSHRSFSKCRFSLPVI